ncbi:MAG: hypothetical protein FP816_00200 [Desulfobacteraceae bacterium]|nr:hypothetical protein [Desulfobacteraceae bacterium]MBU4002201.1 hypothetical protein [Pseudomonadota bacterium]MBU4054765.1 hypothetical protein [Pseudomonadota bacterium]
MTEECRHKNIRVIIENTQRLRCRHCHLTLKEEELAGGYCPECFETRGTKQYDFEEVPMADGGTVRYRCEDCQAWLDTKA